MRDEEKDRENLGRRGDGGVRLGGRDPDWRNERRNEVRTEDYSQHARNSSEEECSPLDWDAEIQDA